MHNNKIQLIEAIYVRVSTEEQAKEGHSIPAQIEVLTQYCKLFNIKIYNIYSDLGISGKDTKNRPGLNSLIADSKKGIFNTVLVWKISRLSRSLKDLLHMVDDFEKHDVSFISYSEKFDTSTAVGKMTLQVLGAIAEFERNTIVENVKLGMSEVVKSGRKAGGSVLGYDSIDKQLVINEKEADIVRLIYDKYVNEKYGFTKIVKYLNSNAYKTKRGGSFRIDSVGMILSNPIYIGLNRHQVGTENEHAIVGIHEPIIDKELFEQAQLRREARKDITARRHEEGIFLLTGMIRCPLCGNKMGSSYSLSPKVTADGNKKVHRYRYYRCNTFQYKRQCKGNLISADRIEKEVISYIANLVENPDIVKHVLEMKQSKLKNDTKSTQRELNNLNAELLAAKNAKERYIKLFESGKDQISDINFIINKINEFDFKISEMETKIIHLQIDIDTSLSTILSPEQIVTALKTFIQLVDVSDENDKKILFQSLIKNIYITSDKHIQNIEFTFNLDSALLV
jgi:site-specific DNA recombinase